MALFRKFKKDIGLADMEEEEEKEEQEEKEEEDEEEEDEEEKKKEKESAKTKNKQKHQVSIQEENKENKKEEDNFKHHKKERDWMEGKGQLAADIYETENEFCVHAPIAGVTQEEIEIFVENEMLIIRGERNEPDANHNKKYYYQECYWGPFTRQIILPDDVNSQKISASFKKGILTIKIPKKKAEKRKIVIEAD